MSEFKFDWQSGYGVFSHSRSQIDAVCKYILNQKEHHHKKTFREEFTKFVMILGLSLVKKNFLNGLKKSKV